MMAVVSVSAYADTGSGTRDERVPFNAYSGEPRRSQRRSSSLPPPLDDMAPCLRTFRCRSHFPATSTRMSDSAVPSATSAVSLLHTSPPKSYDPLPPVTPSPTLTHTPATGYPHVALRRRSHAVAATTRYHPPSSHHRLPHSLRWSTPPPLSLFSIQRSSPTPGYQCLPPSLHTTPPLVHTIHHLHHHRHTTQHHTPPTTRHDTPPPLPAIHHHLSTRYTTTTAHHDAPSSLHMAHYHLYIGAEGKWSPSQRGLFAFRVAYVYHSRHSRQPGPPPMPVLRVLGVTCFAVVCCTQGHHSVVITRCIPPTTHPHCSTTQHLGHGLLTTERI